MTTLSEELASLDDDIEQMCWLARSARAHGDLLAYWLAANLALVFRWRRWLLRRGVPLPLD